MARDVRQWLEELGLDQYAQAFVDNAVEVELLTDLTESDLEKLGVAALGHRKKMLRAIASLASDARARAPGDDVSVTENLRSSDRSGLGERRQLTVMFIDLVGSTELSQKLDPEDLGKLNRAYQAAALSVIEENGGIVAKYLGDGILAYFGYPRAHEDDAEHSVRAGLEVVKRVTQLDATRDLRVRIGIATGTVVVGETIGEGIAQESSVVGATPNLAARLQEIAPPDAVVISEGTSRLLGVRFDLKPLPPMSLKGFSSPISAFAVECERRGQSRFSARTGPHLSSFVGRTEELEILRRRWEKVRGGESQVILVIAEPGMGKSRLVQKACDEISGDAKLIAVFQCSKDHENSSFHPVLAQLRAASHDRVISTDPPDPAQITNYLRACGGLSEDERVLICRSLGMGTGGLPCELTRLDPHQLRERTLSALARYVIASAESSFGICVFEDLHWADPSTLDLIERLVETSNAANCGIFMTTRPGFSAPWIDHPHCTIIQLSRLGAEDAKKLARSARPAGSTLRDEHLRTVIDRAGGIPLFVEELARSAVEATSECGNQPLTEIPATLQDLLMAKLDALEHGKSVAQYGSVLGREFSLSALREIWDSADPTLEMGLEELRGAGLVFSRAYEGDELIQFKHALVQDVSYASLLRSKRNLLHGQVARALVTQNDVSSKAEPELIAHHFTEAREFSEAVKYWARAGERALKQSFYKEGTAHLQRGLQVVGNLTGDQDAQRLEAELLVALGPALIVLLGYAAPDVGRTYERLRTLIDRNSNLTDYLAPTQQGLRLYLLWRGELSAARTVAAELLEQGNRTGDLSQRLEGHKAVAICDLWGGRLEVSRKDFLAALAIADTMPQARPDHVRYDADSRSTCLSLLSWNEWMLGHPKRAEEVSLKAVAAARASEHHFTLGEILSLRCWFLHLQRRHDEAMSVSRETQKLALERDFPVWRALAQIVEGSCRVSNGDLHGGVAKIEQALGAWTTLGCALWLPHHYAVLAVGHLRLGDQAQARELLATAKATARYSQELFWVPELQRLEASVIWQTGDPAATEEMLNQSIREARRHGAKMWEVRAARDLARVLVERGKPEVAREQLSLVCSQFSEGFDTPDLLDVNTLLENLSSETGTGSHAH